MKILSAIQIILSVVLLAEACWYMHLIDNKTKEINVLLKMHDEYEKLIKEKRK